MGRPDRTRRSLLDAAVVVLSKDSSASLSEVATTAGVGRTTLHRYFPTRELLIRALVEDALDRVADAIASAHPDEGPVVDALQRVTDTVVPLGPSLSFLHAEPEVYNARDLIRRWYEALEPVAQAIERGQSDGSLRNDLPVKWVVDAYAGAILTAWDTADEGRIWLQDAPRLVMTTIVHGIATPPDEYAMTRARVMPFVALEGSTLLAGLANGVSMVALPWLVLDLTGRADAAGLVALVSGIPTLFASLFSGTLVDTLGRRRTSVFSDLMSAIAVAAIPIVALTTGLTFTWVLVLAVLGAVFDPAGVTARESMLTGVSQATGMRLERVNGIHEAVWGLAFLVGPAVGAALIATVGVESAFWAMAVAFIASAVLLAFVHVPGAGRPHYDNRPYFWAGTMDGLKLVFGDGPLRTVVLLSTGVVGIAYPVIGIVLPVIYQGNDDPVGLGAIVMAFSFGGVIGALLYSSFGHHAHPRGTFAVALWGAALSLVVFAIWPQTGVMVAAGFAGGILLGPMNPIINLVLQRRTPETMRGRAMGVVTALAYGVYPIGYVLAGILVESFGVPTALGVFAVAAVLLAMLASVAPALKRLDEQPLAEESVRLPV